MVAVCSCSKWTTHFIHCFVRVWFLASYFSEERKRIVAFPNCSACGICGLGSNERSGDPLFEKWPGISLRVHRRGWFEGSPWLWHFLSRSQNKSSSGTCVRMAYSMVHVSQCRLFCDALGWGVRWKWLDLFRSRRILYELRGSADLIDWLTDWLINWLNLWLINWLIDWLTDWLTDLLTECLTDWLTVRLINWLSVLLINWLTDWLTDRLTNWLIDWLNYCLTDWLTNWESYWLTDRPTD
jgi:hypothetical protein